LALESRVCLSLFTVTTNADDGPGSLRQAIQSANGASGGSITIDFNIPDSQPFVITALSALPEITHPVILDATSQTHFAGTPIVELAGNGLAAAGLNLASGSDQSTIKGLAISGFAGAGISISSDSNTIQGNFIGTDASGQATGVGNTWGVFIDHGSNNTIGGITAIPGPGVGNVLSGNAVHGVEVLDAGADNLIAGNIIGLDYTGETTLPNGSEGVSLFQAGPGNSVGAAVAGAANVISGNGFEGIDLSGTNGALVAGNSVGTDITGLRKLGNAVHGVGLTDSSFNTIGGATSVARNVIAGNADFGLYMIDAENLFDVLTGPSNDNLVEGNFIGVDASGIGDLGNGSAGVVVQGKAANNTIGGVAPGEGNVIAFNDTQGIAVTDGAAPIGSATGNTIRGNSIHDNAGPGIFLSNPGLIPAPQIVSAQAGPTTDVTVGVASPGISIDVYASAAPDAAGLGEGERYLGSLPPGELSGQVEASLPGEIITATATDSSGDTSEFSDFFMNSPLQVTNINDSGPGSLRRAISEVNHSSTSSVATLEFAIPGPGPFKIVPTSALPAITHRILIDGTTQAGFAGTPIVELTGDGLAAAGLNLASGSDHSTIKGLAISGFASAGIIISSDSNTIQGNFIGTDASGHATGVGNIWGVYIDHGSNNTIGGITAIPGPGMGNVLSGNAVHGVEVLDGGADNLIAGNIIGLDYTGETGVPNGSEGVSLFFAGTGNSIGGAVAGAGNVLSDNGFEGIDLSGTDGALVAGNLIGTDITGTQKLGNAVHGIGMGDSSFNTIGGTTRAAGNVIAANAQVGVALIGVDTIFGHPGGPSSDNLVVGNSIGVDSSGTIPLGNGTAGVLIQGSANNTIGGTAAGEANTIAFNDADGVAVGGDTATGDTIRGNSIHDNGASGIDLFDMTSPLSPPVILSAQAGAGTNVELSFAGPAASGLTIDIYASSALDASGSAEGQRYLGTLAVSTNASGIGTVDGHVGPSSPGEFITATATDSAGETSEFSAYAIANAFTVTSTSDSGPGSLRQAIIDANATGSPQTISFDITIGADGMPNGAGPIVIGLSSPLPAIVVAVDLDATTQPGFAGTPIVQLAGNGLASDGLTLAAASDGSTIQGLAISGFAGAGIDIQSNGNFIFNDDLGTDLSGNAPGPGNQVGILVSGSNNQIGGLGTNQADVIAFNAGDGVSVGNDSAIGNLIRANSIHDNGALGIDLGDIQSGRFVSLQSVQQLPSETIVSGSYGTVTAGAVTVDFYASPAPDASGRGEGERYLGSSDVSSSPGPGFQITPFQVVLPVTTAGEIITATFTDLASNTTSQFSSYVVAGPITVTSNNDSGAGSLRQALFVSNHSSNSVENTIDFTISGPSEIVPASPLPTITRSVFLNATSQPGYAGTPLVELAGVGLASDGLTLAAGSDGSTIQGLAISGFAGAGIDIQSNGNFIFNDDLGTDLSGTAPGPGNQVGILVSGPNNQIGGLGTNQADIIAFNAGDGVSVVGDSATGNTIRGNSIHDNGGLGIDLGNDGVTLNHSTPTTGIIAGAPNGLENFPVLFSAAFLPNSLGANGTTVLTGTLQADPDSTFVIELFTNPVANPSGYGEGQQLIQTLSVVTDDSGNAVFAAALTTSDLTGAALTATATDPNGNTSEFGQDITVASGSGTSLAIPIGDSAAPTQAELQAVINEIQNLPAGTTLPTVKLEPETAEQLDWVTAAINGLSTQPAPNVTIIVDLGGQTFQTDTTLGPPSSVTVMIENGTLEGGSPALTVTSGSVMLQSVTATNNTSAPTILVTGGSLVVRGSTIGCSSVPAEAAVSIEGGSVDLGTSISPGGNTISINSGDEFVHNTTTGSVPTLGDTFIINGITQSATELSFTTLTSLLNPSVFGQNVKFTVTVTPDNPGDPLPTGIVSFIDPATGTTLGTRKLSSGMASFTTAALGVGADGVIASYGGNPRYLPSLDEITQMVGQADTTTKLSSSDASAVYGEPVTFTANVKAVAPGKGTPTGMVTFFDGTTMLGTGTLSGGIATYTTTAFQMSVGSGQSITAMYNGDANFATNTSTALSQTVNVDRTTTNVASSSNPSDYGHSVTFTATVSPNAPGSGGPTGTVTFSLGATTLGPPVPLNGNTASFTIVGPLAAGKHLIKATYSGDANFKTSAGTVTQTVNEDGTTTSVVSSANPSVVGQSVTFTATVVSNVPDSGVPTGTVTFKDGVTKLGTVTLSGGTALFSTAKLAIGSHAITVTYNDHGNFLTSDATLSQMVIADNTTTSVMSSLNPSTVGQFVTFTATVGANSPGSGTPTGMVTFYDGMTAIGTATLSGGTAKFKTSALAVGSHPITAMYGGDTNFTTSTSDVLIQVVQGAGASASFGSGRFAFDGAIAALDDNSSFNELVNDLACEKALLMSRRRPR
jgi:hypothetical protein